MRCSRSGLNPIAFAGYRVGGRACVRVSAKIGKDRALGA